MTERETALLSARVYNGHLLNKGTELACSHTDPCRACRILLQLIFCKRQEAKIEERARLLGAALSVASKWEYGQSETLARRLRAALDAPGRPETKSENNV